MNFNKAEFDKAFGISQQLPMSDKPEITFAGRSNVGKSSLLNKLFNRKNLARVSSVPGKTVTMLIISDLLIYPVTGMLKYQSRKEIDLES